jgi:uncharacterized iron-regulated membrane protein
MAVVSIEPATMLFLVFVGYSVSGYVIYVWRRAKGEQVSIVAPPRTSPTSVVCTTMMIVTKNPGPVNFSCVKVTACKTCR